MNTNDMNELMRAADVAATKNDRWLFLFMLLVLGAVVFFAVRWLINKYEAATREHRSDLQQYTANLTGITSDVNKTNKDLAVVLERNSAALDDNSTELRLTRENRKRI